MAADDRCAARRLGQGGEHPDHGGLTRSVGAEKGKDGSRLDLQVDAVDGHEITETLGEAIGNNGQFGRGH
jgi:hypothetical protein